MKFTNFGAHFKSFFRFIQKMEDVRKFLQGFLVKYELSLFSENDNNRVPIIELMVVWRSC